MSVPGLKLNALYDYLDNGNFKTGLKLASSLLEKYPKSHMVKALKAYALDRTGKADEAHQICDDLLSHQPLDPDCLHPFKLVLRNLHRLQDITRLYEAALAAHPNDEETALHLFAAYVRDGSLIKQQQLAMKLLKLSGGNEQFQWWVILSIMLQARSALPPHSLASPVADARPQALARRSTVSGAGLDAGKLLQLAESMASRLIARTGKLESLEGLIVYLDLLLAKGQPREALNLVTGPAGGSVLRLAEEKALLHADLAAACGEMREAADVLRTQLFTNPEDWAALTAYLSCLLPGSAAGSAEHEPAQPRRQQQQQQQRKGDLVRPCASSSLLWFKGGLAARMHSGAGNGTVAPPAAHTLNAQDITAALAEACSTIEGMVATVGGQTGEGQGQQQGKGPQVTMRGPHLAKVELAWRAANIAAQGAGANASVTDTKQQALAEAVLGYMRFAGHLYSCAADLRPYLPNLTGQPRIWLLQQLQSLSGFPAGLDGGNGAVVNAGTTLPVAGSEAALRQRISALQVMEGLGAPVYETEAQATQHALQLMRLYADVQGLYKGLDERERAPADELPSLAANALVSAALMAPSDTAATGHLMHALLMLEAVAATRKFTAPIRLALVALHTLLASPGGAKANMHPLRIQHVQLDTMSSHFLLPALLAYPLNPKAAASSGTPTAAAAAAGSDVSRLLAKTCGFFSDHKKEAGETLFTAYNSGTYSKVLEFAAFKERLEAAHTYLMARGETVLDHMHGSLLSAPQPPTAAAAKAVCAQVASAWSSLGYKEVSSQAAGTAGTGQGGGAAQQAPQAGDQAAPPTGVPAHAPLPMPPPLQLQHVRFNEDLSTRPVWYPPLPAPVHLAPACWWEQREQKGLQGNGTSWWAAATASAESPHTKAATWRQGAYAAACARLYLPHLLTSSLQFMMHTHEPLSPTLTHHSAAAQAALSALSACCVGTTPVIEAPQQQQQQQQLEQLEQLDHLDQCLQQWDQGVSGSGWSKLPCSLQLQRLELIVGAAMLSGCDATLQMHAALEPGRVSAAGQISTARLQTCMQRAQAALQATCSSVCTLLAQASSGEGWPLLPGRPLALTAALVHGVLAWLPLFLQVWTDSIQQLQARAKKAKATPQGSEANIVDLSAALAQLTEAEQQARMQISKSLQGVLSQQHGMGEVEQISSNGVQQLWSWQLSKMFDVKGVLQGLAREQGVLVQELAEACRKGVQEAKK